MNDSAIQCLLEFEASVVAYDSSYEKDPSVRIPFFFGLYKWVRSINLKLVDNLENLYKGICKEVLNLDYPRLIRKNHWLTERMARDVENYGNLQLKDFDIAINSSDVHTFADLYLLFEKEIVKLLALLKEGKSTFDNLNLFDNYIIELKKKLTDPHWADEYDDWKEKQVELTIRRLVAKQMQACVEFLNSKVLKDWISVTNDEVDAVKEEELIRWLPSHYRNIENLKELWAKFRLFVDIKEDTIIIPKRQCIRRNILIHINDITDEHLKAIIRLDYLLKLIHRDMANQDKRWAKYLVDNDNFAIVNSLKLLLQQEWFEELRTKDLYNKMWIDQFFRDFMAKWGDKITKEWEVARRRTKLKCRIIGAIKDAGVLKAGYQDIADKVELNSGKLDTSIASYLGEGKWQPYYGWICDYVKR